MNIIKTNSFILIIFFLYSSSFAQSFEDEIRQHREKYKQDFLEDDHSPIKKKEDLQYLLFFKADERYKLKANFLKTEKSEPIDFATMNGKTKKFIEYGTVSFTLKGKKCVLKTYQNLALLENPEYKDHLFLPFTDGTNGNETYEGGRYLDFQISEIADNHLIIDFNKAYNPYCAFSSGYSCPRPPEENNLPLSIKAGEKKFGKASH